MELRHLRYFVAVAEAGSLTEAAGQRLHTSQPSLSRQIRDLEVEVGTALLNRGARGVELRMPVLIYERLSASLMLSGWPFGMLIVIFVIVTLCEAR